MTIYIGADHRGFELKEQLKKWLTEQGHQIEDCGNTVYDPDDDFPDFALAVATEVGQDDQARGIVICGSGVGVSVAANKVKGVRASTAINQDEVHHARAHTDLNVLAISADYTDQSTTQQLVQTFLNTPFDRYPRFQRRLKKIRDYEQQGVLP